MSKIHFIFIALLGSSTTTFADEIQKKSEALTAISKFANDLCSNKVLEGGIGSTSSYVLTGEAKAELSKVLKTVADIGVKGSIDFRGTEYEGVLQEDLVGIIKDGGNCKLEVWRDLKDKLIPKTQITENIATYSIRLKTFPLRIGEVSGVKFDLYLDDNFVTEVANFPTNTTYNLGKINRGVHTYRFENIKAYFFDYAGSLKLIPELPNMECEGDIAVTRSKAFETVVLFDKFGRVHCDLR